MRFAHGLGNAIMLFLGSILVAALIIAALNGPFETILGVSNGVTTTQEAATGVSYISTFWDLVPFVVVALGLIQLVGTAAAEANL